MSGLRQAPPASMQIPAGWYADPDGSGNWRWWSGVAWTEHVQSPTAPPVATQTHTVAQRPAPREPRLGVLIALLALVVAATAGGLTLFAGNDGRSAGGVGRIDPAAAAVTQQPPAPSQRQLLADDGRAKQQALTAQVAMETYATDHAGSYLGVSAPSLLAVQPSLADAAISFPEATTDATYVVEILSGTGNRFSIRRLASGAVERTCEKRGKAGCPASGRW